ncbi:hypothetical protein QJS04_geneDACA008265 [Acorus gramineus]|uniref:Reverse transcriptase n=1 Tax=Acorus gramineus TaxID=55184 RepID=A0AAV9AXI7_ACOGR|nr:hypothetical protein QJS04_geneDACA008265 [Acorus gramineus]
MKVISTPSIPTGPRPFKYFESWEAYPSFAPTVHEAWNSPIDGNPMFRFVKKLAKTKLALKSWNKEAFGPIQLNLSNCKRDLATAQYAPQMNPRYALLMEAENIARPTYLALLSQEERFATQKSRQLWLAARDSNTKFFYNSIKSRSARNSISRLRMDDGSLSSNLKDIKAHIIQFYSDLLNWKSYSAQQLPPPLNSVTAEENISPCAAATEDEIHASIRQMKALSSPGPDGFPVRFYQLFWMLIKDDLMLAINYFFMKGSLLPQALMDVEWDS